MSQAGPRLLHARHLGFTWEEFCTLHTGISRRHADNLIHQYGRFGDAYFRRTEIAPVSPKTFRQIAAQITPDTIELDGQPLALTPKNAPRIYGSGESGVAFYARTGRDARDLVPVLRREVSAIDPNSAGLIAMPLSDYISSGVTGGALMVAPAGIGPVDPESACCVHPVV
jgi:hypothetical protein